ncbi:hypothetical protein [Amycolatopsis taiwanensis]|uniref:hypothetical protein n=1 Tax=Amycolatopsis taiwanensis TaxID=342230 RepID=UPI000483284D|nr:hypothetical protein [Amycolatopsis taiwanensis]
MMGLTEFHQDWEGLGVHWWQFALLGAGGGALVEILAIFKWLAVWQSARRTSTGKVKGSPPKLRSYLDVPVHAWMAVFRTVLGAGSAVLFGAGGGINGPYVAVALGFAAPSMLAQLGTIPQVAAAIRGAPDGSVQRLAPTGLSASDRLDERRSPRADTEVSHER